MYVTAFQAALFSVDPFGDRSHHGYGLAFLVPLSFVLSFLAIRTSARLTRRVSCGRARYGPGDVHIHHLVWGICLIMLSGFLSFVGTDDAPLSHVTAVGFGVGAGFTMDELALWVHLEDVYWE